MKYGCSGSGAITCKVSLDTEQKSPDRKKLYRSYDIVSLNKDLSRSKDISASKAPYLIVLPNLLQSFHYMNWRIKKKDITYYTSDKATPSPNEIWMFKTCKKSKE